MTTTTNTPDTPAPAAREARVRRARLAAAAYFVLAAVGGVGTWSYNIAFGASGTGGSLGDYLAGWFANDASSSAAVDIIVVTAVAFVFYLREARRLGWSLPRAVVFVLLSLVVAVAFALPLFLGLRELSIARTTGRTHQAPKTA